MKKLFLVLTMLLMTGFVAFVQTTHAQTSDSAAATTETKKRPPIFRANKDQVSEAQRKLKAGKMYDGEETGKLDDATRDGIKKFQTENGVKVTGTLNKETLVKMGIQLTDKQKEM